MTDEKTPFLDFAGLLNTISASDQDEEVRASVPEPDPTESEESEIVPEYLVKCIENIMKTPVPPGLIDTKTIMSIQSSLTRLKKLIGQRSQFGEAKYGTQLMTHNGRDSMEDAYQELGDMLMYVTQAIMEDRFEEVSQFLISLNDSILLLRTIAEVNFNKSSKRCDNPDCEACSSDSQEEE